MALKIHKDSIPLYGEVQLRGIQLRKWIADPKEPNCHIPRNTLTMDSLADTLSIGKRLVPMAENLDCNLQQQILDLGLPYEYETTLEKSAYRCFGIVSERLKLRWFGYTGPGMISLDDISRKSEFTDHTMVCRIPHISEMTQVLYAEEFSLEELKHIFVTDIINEETCDLIIRKLYTIGTKDLLWPVFKPHSWEYGTPEYDALLGTRIGKVVAYIVLGAFQRGSRRISRITVWSNGILQPNLRFDIEPVP